VGRHALNPEERSSPRTARTTTRRHGSSEALTLDPIIHERVRLGIISALAVNDTLTFNDLKGLLEITDGNLSVHARKLEEAGYVRCTKSFVGRQPRTEFKLTTAGRRALENYLEQMESVIRSTRTIAKE
jgi:DNA-binding MarR family transcriptional regulator